MGNDGAAGKPDNDGKRQPTGTMMSATPPPAAGLKTPAPAASPPSNVTEPEVESKHSAIRQSQNAIKQMMEDGPMEIVPGTPVGEYEVTGKLGEGGMGEVYSAVHPIIGKKVAVKVLAEHVAANREVIRRFVAEARAVNQIGHRNIVDVFAFGQLEDGRQYYIMEHLVGKSLEEELEERGTLTAEEIVEFLGQSLDALQAAHDEGIIHRDLKPDNIFIIDGRKREAKLLDFGIAKLTGEEQGQSKTRTGMAMGTPDFMSPEQCRGAGVDHRTDIYAMGVILYECFTGRLPFEGENPVDLFFKHMHEAPTPPSSHATVAPAFETIILRCLAKEADDRYATARELAEALTDALTAPGPAITGKAQASTADRATKPAEQATPRAAAPLTEKVDVPQAAATDGQGSNKGLIFGAVGVLVVAAGVGGFFMMKGGGDAEGADTQTETEAAAQTVAEPDPPKPEPAPDPDPPVEPPAKPTSGTLVVSTGVDDAQVFIRGKQVGQGATVEITDLDKGEVAVTVRAEGYKDQMRILVVEAGERTRRAFVLEKDDQKTSSRKSGRKTGRKKPPKNDPGDDKKPDPKPVKDPNATVNPFGTP